jgi:hypothetical protein
MDDHLRHLAQAAACWRDVFGFFRKLASIIPTFQTE